MLETYCLSTALYPVCYYLIAYHSHIVYLNIGRVIGEIINETERHMVEWLEMLSYLVSAESCELLSLFSHLAARKLCHPSSL